MGKQSKSSFQAGEVYGLIFSAPPRPYMIPRWLTSFSQLDYSDSNPPLTPHVGIHRLQLMVARCSAFAAIVIVNRGVNCIWVLRRPTWPLPYSAISKQGKMNETQSGGSSTYALMCEICNSRHLTNDLICATNEESEHKFPDRPDYFRRGHTILDRGIIHLRLVH